MTPQESTNTSVSNRTILTREQHPISHKHIDKQALFVLKELERAGYEAYLVGGCIRDLFLGFPPKDFDIVTNAHPEEVADLFENCRLIGRRFRLAHIYFGRDFLEVATFRGMPKGDVATHDLKTGMIHNDNVYGTIEEDALRRDFTINALYYNAKDFTVHDFTNGIEDLKNKQIKVIGDPVTRYQEDPVRMLRAIRHAAKLGLEITPETAEPIKPSGHLLRNIAPARLFEEALKLLIKGAGEKTFEYLQAYNLFHYLFPQTQSFYQDDVDHCQALIHIALRNTDTRIKQDKPINPAFLLATLLWYPFIDEMKKIKAGKAKMSTQDCRYYALEKVVRKQAKTLSIPKRFTMMIQQIWDVQERLIRKRPKSIYNLLEHKRFRAAYDFILLRVESGEESLAKVADWWTDFQEADSQKKNQMFADIKQRKKKSS